MVRKHRLVTGMALLLAVAVLGCSLGPAARQTEEQPTLTAGPDRAMTTPSAEATEPRTGSERIVILHTNDMHGAVEASRRTGGSGSGGLVGLVSLIDEMRAQDPERTLLLDAGDTFQGTYVSNTTQGEVVMAAMNIAGYDAWTLGNHEFDWGQEALRARIAQAEFPVLAANVVDVATEQVWDVVKPYTIVTAGRARVAIVGLAYADTPAISKPKNVAGLEFQGGVETVRRLLPEIEGQADLVVVLSHLGYEGDVALAQAMQPGSIDVIVGGHSHIFMEQPERVNGTIIAQAGTRGQALGRLELTTDLSSGEVALSQHGLVRVGGDPDRTNEEVRRLVEKAVAEAAETTSRPIGRVARPLEPQRSGEFALGNLVVDAMLATDLDGRQADVAFHNNGGIRAGLPRGEITYGQLYNVLPFDNQLIGMDLTGAQIRRILERSVAGGTAQMQVAGLAFRFSPNKPSGQKVLEVTVGGRPLDPGRAYRVVTIDYLALGGDDQDTFTKGTSLSYGESEVWAVAEYIRTHSPVDPKVEGRIRGQ